MKNDSPCTDMRTTAWRLALLCMALWGVVYYLRLFDQKLLLGDEGTILLDAWRIASGEIPHRDFFQGFPPASFIPTAALFLLFGPSLLAGRLLAFALAVSIVLSLDLVLRKLEADRVLRLLSLALLIPFGVSYWPIPSHHWWAALHCLLSAYFLLSAPGSRKPRHAYFSAGVFAALAAFSLQDQGGYFIIFTALLYLPALEGRERKEAIWGGLTGVGTVALLFSAWLLPTAGIGNLVNDLLVFPLTSYHNIEGHKFDLFSGWRSVMPVFSRDGFGKAPLYLGSMTLIAFFFMLVPVISFASLSFGRVRKLAPSPQIAVAASLAISAFLTALHRWSFTNLVWALPGLLPAMFLLWKTSQAKRFFSATAIVIVAAATVFSVSFYRAAAPERLVTIASSAGSLRAFNSGEVQDLLRLLDHIERFKKPGDTLFCSGFHSLINIFTLMKNPTPFDSFLVFNTESQYQRLFSELGSERITWICMPKTRDSANARIIPVISGKYDLSFENDRYMLYRLREQYRR